MDLNNLIRMLGHGFNNELHAFRMCSMAKKKFPTNIAVSNLYVCWGTQNSRDSIERFQFWHIDRTQWTPPTQLQRNNNKKRKPVKHATHFYNTNISPCKPQPHVSLAPQFLGIIDLFSFSFYHTARTQTTFPSLARP